MHVYRGCGALLAVVGGCRALVFLAAKKSRRRARIGPILKGAPRSGATIGRREAAAD